MSKASNRSKQLRQHRSQTSKSTRGSRRSTPSRRERLRQLATSKAASGTSNEQDRSRVDASANGGLTAPAVSPQLLRLGLGQKQLPHGSLQKIFDKSPKLRGRPSITEISREATAGGVIYRFSKKDGLEILLVADHFDRWTIPKGHIEEGETAQETAIREIGEEAGVHQLEPVCWLGKIHFRYRRENVLVLMSTQIYLFHAVGDTDSIQKEDWMNDIKWFSFEDAVNIIAYRDIAKLMRLGYRRLQQKGEID